MIRISSSLPLIKLSNSHTAEQTPYLVAISELIHAAHDQMEHDTLSSRRAAVLALDETLYQFLAVINTLSSSSSKRRKIPRQANTKQILTQIDKVGRGNIPLEQMESLTKGLKRLVRVHDFITSTIHAGPVPMKDRLHPLYKSAQYCYHLLSSEIMDMDAALVWGYLQIEDDDIRGHLYKAHEDLNNEDYHQCIKMCALAFSIALEIQRQQLNYLWEIGELSTNLFLNDSPGVIHFKLQDHSFLLLMLEVDPKKYDTFEGIVPTTFLSYDKNNVASVTISDFIEEKYVTLPWAWFCLNFVEENLLHWQSLEFTQL